MKNTQKKWVIKTIWQTLMISMLGVNILLAPVSAAALHQTSQVSGGEEVGRNQQMDIVATAYAPGPHDNGKWGNLTHIGTQVRPGVIAVDPKVIPLGSKLYIEFPDGRTMYGVAEDTGGAIKGNRIDIAMWTVAEAYEFGIQKIKVRIIN